MTTKREVTYIEHVLATSGTVRRWLRDLVADVHWLLGAAFRIPGWGMPSWATRLGASRAPVPTRSSWVRGT